MRGIDDVDEFMKAISLQEFVRELLFLRQWSASVACALR